MSRAERGRRQRACVAVAVAGALSLSAGVAGAAGSGAPDSGTPTRLAPRASGAWIAHPVLPTRVWTRPGGGRVRWRTPRQTSWASSPVGLLVLGSATADGRQWLKVRLPIRPNNAAGWIDAGRAQLRRTPWRIVLHLRRRRIDVYRAGRLARSFSAVVGKPSTPTPRGRFAIWEQVPEPDPTGFIGPWALHLTAHSDVLHSFGGGPGRVAIHGRDGTSLLDPLGSARSHGCIRIADPNIRWLASVLRAGVPVRVQS